MDMNSKGEMIIWTRRGEIIEINLKIKIQIKISMKSNYDKELLH